LPVACCLLLARLLLVACCLLPIFPFALVLLYHVP
jgi:hypothetical protein